MKKRDNVISKVKACVKKTSHKYGIHVPSSVREAYQIDKNDGNTYWTDAITEEMKSIRVASDILENDRKVEPGRTFLEC